MRKYPKLLIVALCTVLAYVLYHYGVFNWLDTTLNGHGYPSIILGGLMFSLGFTTPFAIAIFITAAPHVNPFIAAPIAGIGALAMDMTIFRYAKLTLNDELQRLGLNPFLQRVHALFRRVTVTDRVRTYVLWSIAGLVIASPLPDEIGITLLSTVKSIDERRFALLCYVLNTIGILIMLLLAQ